MAIWRSCGRSATVLDPKAPQMGKACDSIMWQPAMGEAPWFSCTRGKLISQPQTPRHHWTYSLHEFEDCGLTIISFSTPTHGFPESPSDSGPQLKASLKGKNSKHFQPLYLEKVYGGSSATHSPHSFSTPWKTPACFKFTYLSSYRCQRFGAVKCSSSCCFAKISSSPPEDWLPSSNPRTDVWVDADTLSSLTAIPWELKTLFLLFIFICILLGNNNKVLLY